MNVASASGVPPHTIDRHQPALHESSMVKSPCHIPTVASWLTDERSFSTRRAVHRLPPSTRPNSLNYGLQTRPITASKFISKLAGSRPPSASPKSLDYGLQTRSITASKCISKLARLRPPSASPKWLDYGLQVSTIMASKCISPNSLDHGLQVYL